MRYRVVQLWHGCSAVRDSILSQGDVFAGDHTHGRIVEGIALLDVGLAAALGRVFQVTPELLQLGR